MGFRQVTVAARTLLFGLTATLALSAGAPAAPGETITGSSGEFDLTTGRAVFWDGKFFESWFNPSADTCVLPGSGCPTYRLNVTETGSRLRVAIDHRSLSDAYDIRLYDPNGIDVTPTAQRDRGAAEAAAPTGAFYSHEVVVTNPRIGVWTVRVSPTNVSSSSFRMRAELEKARSEPASRPRVALLPNLQVVPPYELTFDSGFAQDGSDSCTQVEREKYPLLITDEYPRCLRFSAGPINVGQGMWEVILTPEPGRREGTAFQRIHYSDDTHEDREAGTFEYHDRHHHYHHTAIGGFELLEVLDPKTGALSARTTGPKIGFCTGDQVIAEWRSLRSDPPRSAAEMMSGACSGSPSGGSIGLTKGWGDMYHWYVEGNFVPFPAAGDGLYVVRVRSDTAEDGGTFVETNESDNIAYTYIRVSGDDIDVLERGRGRSPWDPGKTIVKDTRHDHPSCPPSTTQHSC